VTRLRRFLRILGRVALVLVGLLLLLGAFVWWKLRPHVDPIPAALASVTADELADVTVPGDGGLPDLRLREARGHVAFFVFDSRESMQAKEGRLVHRALDRWVFPDGALGYAIGDAEGMRVFKWQIDKFMKFIRRESRLPLYVDYDGALRKAFKLPRGHNAIIVLGPDGAVRFRHAGDMTEAELGELRAAIGAREPPPPPPAPAFAAGPLSSDACRGQACAIVFLGHPVALEQVPGVKGGASQKDEKAWADPTLRLAGMFADEALPRGKSRGVFVGQLDGVTLADGWSAADDDGAARRAFGVPEGEAALVVVDGDGRLVLRELGVVPFWKVSRVTDLLGLKEE
jgi:hypothetical protein